MRAPTASAQPRGRSARKCLLVDRWFAKELFLGLDAKSSIVNADRFRKNPRHERLQPKRACGTGAACGGRAPLAPPVIACDFGAIRSRRHRFDARYESGDRA